MYITNKVQPSNDCFSLLIFCFYGLALATPADASLRLLGVWFVGLFLFNVDWKQHLNIKSREEFNLPEFKHAFTLFRYFSDYVCF